MAALRFSPAKLRAARHQRGLTLAKLADRSGHSYSAVANAELGVSVPRANALADMAAVLDIDICALFDHAPSGHTGGAA